MKSIKPIKIAVLPGDGIGIEVTHAAIPVFRALEIPVSLTFGDIGWSYWKKEGSAIPERTWTLIANSDTTLLGAITSKPQREAKEELNPQYQNEHLTYVSPIIQLRQTLDLFANIRPCFSIKEENKPFKCCIIRENTEGLYSGFDYYPTPNPLHHIIAEHKKWGSIPGNEISCSFRLQSKSGLLRLFQFAFQYAADNYLNRVTFADKPNVLRNSGAFARDIFEQVATQYPQIHADILNVDAVALWLIRRPEEFGVIVAENMFGDILSDVGAGVMGGLGFAPSANIGLKGCYFEPVHGSAPRVKSNCANPSAMFLTISMLLSHFGFINQAQRIINAVTRITQEQQHVTYDMGGNATTQEMAHAIIDHCMHSAIPCDTSILDLKNPHEVQLLAQEKSSLELYHQLSEFSSAQISDALDACHIEGALLHIHPLTQGTKLIGPAYTVRYLPYIEKLSLFKNAANYIDDIPAHSVVLIDNNGMKDCTVWGDLLTQVAMRKNLAGTVVHGAVRDVDFIRKAKYPLYCSAIYMRSGKNRIHKVGQQCPIIINGVMINPGDIIFGDDNGVLVIPLHLVNDVIDKAKNIKLAEQNISMAIENGSSLAQARADYRYDQPWLDVKQKNKE